MGEERKNHRSPCQRVTEILKPTVRTAPNQGIWNVLEEEQQSPRPKVCCLPVKKVKSDGCKNMGIRVIKNNTIRVNHVIRSIRGEGSSSSTRGRADL